MIHKLYSSLALAIMLSHSFYGEVQNLMLTSLLWAAGFFGFALTVDWISACIKKNRARENDTQAASRR